MNGGVSFEMEIELIGRDKWSGGWDISKQVNDILILRPF
jgi:hypothetical protein